VNIAEAIQHCWEKSKDQICPELCKEDHVQLALWLEELVGLRIEIAELKKVQCNLSPPATSQGLFVMRSIR